MIRQRRTGIIVVLGALSAIGPFSIDMYLPSFSSIASDLKTSIDSVGYSLTSYFIGIAVGQLAYGPITDRYGRKRPILAGLLLYLAATLASAFTPGIAWLVVARLFMALGAAAGMVAGRAVVRDLFPVSETASIFSTFTLIIAVSPIFAPSVGGYLSANLSWRVIFFILSAISVILYLTVYLGLPESKESDPSISLRPAGIIAQYLQVAREPQFAVYTVGGGLVLGGLFAYIAGAPFVFLHLYGLSQVQFGQAFALVAMGLILGSQVNRLLLKRFDARAITRVSVGAQIVVAGLLSLGALAHRAPLPGVFALLVSYLFCFGVASPNATAIALEPFSLNAGSASALLGGVQMGIGALATWIVSVIADGSALPMAATMLATAVLCWGLLLRFERTRGLRLPAAAA